MFVGPDFVLVADTGNARLALLADDGEFVAAYTQPLPPYDDLPLAGPRSLAWDPVFGRLVVSDREPPRVVDLAPVRPYRAWFPVAGRP